MLTRIFLAMLFAGEVMAGEMFDGRGLDRPGIFDDLEPEFSDDLDEVWIRPTMPGTTVPDWNQPGYLLREDSMGTRACQTFPGTRVCDYSAPGFIIR